MKLVLLLLSALLTVSLARAEIVVITPGYEGPTAGAYLAPQAEPPWTPVPKPVPPTPLPPPVPKPPPPSVTARWVSATHAEITWDGGNLYRIAGGVETLLASGSGSITLPPPPPADAAYWPAVGDRYVVRDPLGGDITAVATLGTYWRRWLPVVSK